MDFKKYLIIIGLIALGAFIIYVIVRSIIDSIQRNRFRRINRESQFSGAAHKEEKGIWESIIAPKYSSRAEKIGVSGENKVSSYLEDLPWKDYMVFNDLLIRDGKYTTQVDHIIISRYGIFVIETKNVHGTIYGSGNAEFWKQYLPDTGYKRHGYTQEHQLRNPILQNAGHIKTLRRLVLGYDIPIYGIVAFPNETDINITVDEPVLKMWDIVPFIKDFHDIILSDDQMRYMRRHLLEVISTTESARKEHLDNVNRNKERRDANVMNGRCPRCGGYLVLRKGQYGEFYGCSNYPSCKYILNK